MIYDYLIVGAGLYGSMFAYIAKKKGYKCLVVEKRDCPGGFCRTSEKCGIIVHNNGAHIFRTDSRKVWEFVNSKVSFTPFVNSPLANYKGKMYNLPFNMNTFKDLFGVTTPEEAKEKIKKTIEYNPSPSNLEEHCINLIGRKLYEMFIKGYTEKQWGRKCSELPASIIKRIPLRFTFDNNYFNERYQGIPDGGYNALINSLLDGTKVIYNADYNNDRYLLNTLANKVIYTGSIDKLFDYKFGRLDYRAVRFEHVYFDNIDNYQGNAVVNYTGKSVPYTRIIEHKHFVRNNNCNGTVITKEYPTSLAKIDSPCYPINDKHNNDLYARYISYAKEFCPKIEFGGRLGEYKYYSMNDIIEKFIDGKEN